MKRNRFFFKYFSFVFMLVAISLCSCISNKSVILFNNLPDSARLKLEKLQPPQSLIQINDILLVKIGGENEKTSAYINSYYSGNSPGLSAIVDIDGNIELPKIGKLKLAGLTRNEAKNTITNAYKEYLVDPIVSVTFGNFRFSVLGEVNVPGNYDIPSQKVTILEALAHAGDFTQYAQRNNVRIIRDVNNEREIISIDLNDKKILNSEDYYLHTDDVIYVEAKNVKQVTENFQRTVTYFTAITSLLAIFLVIFRK